MEKPIIFRFFSEVMRHREMIFVLSARDLQSRYAGTLGGMIWAFVHPLAAVCIFYFVFAVGFRAHGPDNIPFILWFVCGLTPWYFFNDTLQIITNSITSNAYLVTKTVFPTEILPLVYIISGLFPHFVFLLLLTVMMGCFHVPFSADRLLIIYYLGCTMTLLLGLGWLLSALQVFYRDIGQALTIMLNLWFWMTPIVWVQNIVPAVYQGVLMSNPIYYIVQGYRGLMVYKVPVWPDLHQTVVFWIMALAILAAGGFAFRRLKPEFADVI